MSNADIAKQWERYLQYLKDWAETRADNGFIGCCPVCFDEWLDCEGREYPDCRLPECDSEHCTFNPKGLCWIPILYNRQPDLDENGCSDYVYKE